MLLSEASVVLYTSHQRYEDKGRLHNLPNKKTVKLDRDTYPHLNSQTDRERSASHATKQQQQKTQNRRVQATRRWPHVSYHSNHKAWLRQQNCLPSQEVLSRQHVWFNKSHLRRNHRKQSTGTYFLLHFKLKMGACQLRTKYKLNDGMKILK